MWINDGKGYLQDWLTQVWVKTTGRKVNFDDYKWLSGPTGSPKVIADEFIYRLAEELSLDVAFNEKGSGLIEKSEDFGIDEKDKERLDPAVLKFYRETSNYDFDVWSKWNRLWEPFGRLLSVIFSKRLRQLNLPLDPLVTSLGMDSEIIKLKSKTTGETVYTIWFRKLIKTGEVIYSGTYGICTPPNLGYKCLKVSFPLPNGSATVVLKPVVKEDGSFLLISQGKKIGDAGFYFILKKDDKTGWIRYVKAMHETLHVFKDKRGILRTDHLLNLWGSRFLTLHYKINNKIPK